MSLARRHEYLKAIGIEPWVSRPARRIVEESALAPAAAKESAMQMQPSAGAVEASALLGQIMIGPGRGHTLLLCGSAAEAATELAADVARSLEGEPVWGWPATDECATGIPLAQVIEEHLFTRVMIFGSTAATPAGNAASQVAGSAHLIWVDPIPVLIKSGAARRRLWLTLSTQSWCAVRA